MEKLPTELLEKILLLLRGPERLRAALVCKRWAEIVSASRSLRDICLVLRVAELDRATPTLLESHRRYTHLKISHGKLMRFHMEFLTRIAGGLVSLQLEACDTKGTELFYAILGRCQKLQSLEFRTFSPVERLRRLEPEYHEKIGLAKVQQSLRNVRHLSLRENLDVADDSFNHMLTLVPNITSLCLAGCSHLEFHPSNFRSFDADTIDFPSPMLTFQNVLACMIRSKQEFVDLDFSDTRINDEALIQIVELYRESLTNLRLDYCRKLTAEAYEAIGECSELRLLSLHQTFQTDDDNLELILTKTPDLEYLDLGHCELISSQSLRLIVKLRKLRYLNLYACRRIDINSLGSLRALTKLQHLDLSYTDCDAETFRQLASLKDLRTLELCGCSNLTPECFEIVCDNFKRLEKLNFRLTLTDETGYKFHQLKNLRSLDITHAKEISDRSLKNGMGAPDMKMLSMGSCSWLTDGALVSIVNHHVCLEYLDLSGCVRITDVGLISALQCLPRLRALILQYCRALTDQSLFALKDHCPHLRELDVWDCPMSSDAKYWFFDVTKCKNPLGPLELTERHRLFALRRLPS